MSLRPQDLLPPVPDDTARVARAAFPRGTPYLLLRDRLGTVFADSDFADLYPRLGQPAYAPWRLALVTVMQFREGLSDRGAAEAVRATTESLNARSLDAARRGGKMLSQTEALNAASWRGSTPGAELVVGTTPQVGRAAAVDQHAPSAVASKKLAVGHADPPAAPVKGWFGGGRSGGLSHGMRSLASAAADKASLGGPNGTYDLRPPQLARGRVKVGPRPF